MIKFIFTIIFITFIYGAIHQNNEKEFVEDQTYGQLDNLSNSINHLEKSQKKYNELKKEVDKMEKELDRNHDLNRAINNCEARNGDCSIEYAYKALSDYNHDHNFEQ